MFDDILGNAHIEETQKKELFPIYLLFEHCLGAIGARECLGVLFPRIPSRESPPRDAPLLLPASDPLTSSSL